jgi:2-methylisocitrate lyase-like PEP mutase family enzyme
MSSFEKFLQLHKNQKPLLFGNIWDVNSAKVFEANKYEAIGTSSQAVAKSFGYEDGERIPFDILLQLAKRVAEVVRIPFSVDLEAGYDRTIHRINENINRLHDAGVVGINLEDTVGGKQQSVNEFSKMLSSIADYVSRNDLKIFLNIRTDGFLLGMPDALAETLNRIKNYEQTGVNGIFVPCITKENDIQQVTNATNLPINVMCMPALPNFEKLQSLGVKRISMGPFLFNRIYDEVGRLSREIVSDKNFSSIV